MARKYGDSETESQTTIRCEMMLSTGKLQVNLSLGDADRFREEYHSFLKGGGQSPVFHWVDENVEQYLRFDAIEHCRIEWREVPAEWDAF